MINSARNQKLPPTKRILNQVHLAFIEANKTISGFEKRENIDAQIAKDFLQKAEEMVKQAVLKGLNNK